MRSSATNQELSVRKIIERARSQGDIAADIKLPSSTVHRLLTREGLMAPTPQSPGNDMRRFAYSFAGELWQADAMHGPRIADERGRKRKTYLLAIIDDATRLIPYASFTFADNTPQFLLVLREAIARRGLTKRLYVDNGSSFRSRQLAIICARLGITLIYARPRHASGKGKIERWFRSVRQMFLSHLDLQTIPDLESLNKAFRVWVESEYHYTPHRGIDGDTPLDRWARCEEQIQFPDPRTDLTQMFLFENPAQGQQCPHRVTPQPALRSRSNPAGTNRHPALRSDRAAFATPARWCMTANRPASPQLWI